MNVRTKLTSACLAVLALVLAWSFLLPVAAGAQAAGATLVGKVADSNGGALPGATVTATQKDTGISRSTVAESDGTFRLPSLQAGTYTLTVELDGFATVTVQDVTLNVATSRELTVTMNSSKMQESITVVDEAPLMQTEPTIGAVVSQRQLENLPLNGRQFANLAILAPGTALSYNSDPTKPGQLTVALNGGSGRNVNFVIDGGDNTDDTIGGALQNFNLESVQEFNIQTQQYKAEYGRSTGGVLTVVTKTGTNEFRGSGWGFFRDKSLNSITETEKEGTGKKGDYKRKQYGASLGGPLVKDKAHFFVTYEKTKRDTSYTVNSGGDLPEFDGKSFATPFTDDLATAKMTWQLNPKQYLQVRYGYQKNDDKYGASPGAAPDSLGTVANKYSSFLGGWSAQIGADSLNELTLQYTKFDNVISADSNNPSVYFPSGAHRGQNINTPQSTHQKKKQLKDDYSFSRSLWGRNNNFKAGFSYIDEPTLGGDFSTGLNGQYTLDAAGHVTDITINGGFFGEQTPIKEYSAYFQDDLIFSDRLTLNIGLRYDYNDGFDLDQHTNPIWQTLSTQTKYNEGYLRDFQGGKGGKLKNDTNNWGPRLGFTWDTKGDGKALLRGGWGIYYDFPYTNATILFPAASVQSNFGVAYNVNNSGGIKNPDGSFFRIGQPLPPNGIPGGQVNPPNEVASPTLATPFSRQASLGYSWQANSWLGINVEAVTIDYRDIPYRFRANPKDPATITPSNPSGNRRFSDFANFRLWYGKGFADYDGANLSFRARVSQKFELQGFYTYSKSTGNVLAGADEFRITDAAHQPDIGGARRDVSVNPLNPSCGACTGPLDTDARHRITLSGLYSGPWGVNVSGMLRYRSAQPYTFFLTDDLNHDGFNYDLPAGTTVNSKRGHSFSQVDLRLSKEFRFGDGYGFEVIAETFNLFNEKNPNAFDRFGQPSVFAGDPLQGEQRLTQIGVRVHF
jgi:hypothetical protein